MTREHYEAIAVALLGSRPSGGLAGSPGYYQLDAWLTTAKTVRDAIGQFNDNFDADRFNKAAGITEVRR